MGSEVCLRNSHFSKLKKKKKSVHLLTETQVQMLGTHMLSNL